MTELTSKTSGAAAPVMNVVIEIPRGSFFKRDARGYVDFVSPLPCPFNYGATPDFIGGDGDFLDTLVLGPRLAIGTRLKIPALGSVGMHERHMYDDKLICSHTPISDVQLRSVLLFFRAYALYKDFLHALHGRRGRCQIAGWEPPEVALGRARPAGSRRYPPPGRHWRKA